MTTPNRAVGWRFWLIALVAMASIWATASLGYWQLSRAAQKEAVQGSQDSRAALPVLEGRTLVSGLAAAPKADYSEALVYRRIELEGRWLPEHTVYLDNRQMQGRPGFFVLTPLLLKDGSGVVLVQRGWIARNFLDRSLLPVVETWPGDVQVSGRVAWPPSKLYEFQSTDNRQGSSRIRQNLDLDAFRTETGLPLAPLTVVQSGLASEGLQRDWPVVAKGVDKHYGYAFQWFGLSALIAILYVWFQIFRRFIRPRSKPAA